MRDNSQATKEINHNNIQLIQKECREKREENKEQMGKIKNTVRR